jgi:DNA-damage-inducible protein J
MKGEYTMAVKADTSMTIRMNREVKQKAQMVFAELGMDMTTAINVFLRQAIYHKGFPFEVVLKTPNDVTLAAMEAAENDKDMHGPFDSVSDLMDALNA